jgi:hypothetical protein
MAPAKATDSVIAKQLAGVVRQIYNGPDRDQLTVNHAREAAEKKLKLEDGFLKAADWKAKSKQIIVETLVSHHKQAAGGSRCPWSCC